LLEGQKDWVRKNRTSRSESNIYNTNSRQITNLANASSLIFNSSLAFPKHFGNDTEKAINWCGKVISHRPLGCPRIKLRVDTGFYIHSTLYPSPRYSISSKSHTPDASDRLLLGPFCGKPACQFISITPGNASGVCADAYMQRRTLIVPDVGQYPGHIACDGETKSEIVVPLIYQVENKTVVMGVMDLDCLAIDGFDEGDREGLENIAELIVNSCNW
jgi:L-methionine (R)-S-oxide reductase